MITKKSYLVAFNFLSSLSWFYTLVQIYYSLKIVRLPYDQAWSGILFAVRIAQSLAILEIAHVLLSYVRSDLVSTSLQVLSRIQIVWLIWSIIPYTSFANITTIIAWSLIEIIRYPYYMSNTIYGSNVPFWLLWLRYSGFIILYPIGIVSELITIVKSLPILQHSPSYRNFPYPMPNLLNFQIDLYVLYIFVIILYIPGAICLFSHMWSQRNKALQKHHGLKSD